ncbi:MAG: ATP-binding cassette domain-containing protein, partial [Spirochaetota bacterium]
MNKEKIIEIDNLHTYFYTNKGIVKAVRGLSMYIDNGETLGIVGESGCGKSVTSLSIMRLVPHPPGKIVDGKINFMGKNLLKSSDKEMRAIRGNKITMIFQEPMTSLNPVYRVGEQILEVMMTHTNIKKKEAMDKAIETLKLVGIPSPEKRINS